MALLNEVTVTNTISCLFGGYYLVSFILNIGIISYAIRNTVYICNLLNWNFFDDGRISFRFVSDYYVIMTVNFFDYILIRVNKL